MVPPARRGRLALSMALVAAVTWAAPVEAAPGDLDRTFGDGGRVVTNPTKWSDGVADMTIQSNGRIVVVGRTIGRRYGMFGLARYRPDGRLDPTFGGDGLVRTNMAKREDSATAVAIQPDGRIVAVGTANVQARWLFAIARYDRDGTLDTTFGKNGRVRIGFTPSGDDAAADVAIQPDGKIVVIGSSFVLDRFALARLDPDGTLDDTFHADGKVTTNAGDGTDSAGAVAIQPDGKIVVAGQSWTLSGWDGIDVVRYETDGTMDPTFGTDGIATVDLTEGSDGAGDMASGIALQPDGKIVVAGDAGGSAEFTSGFGLARFAEDGTLDVTFQGDGTVVTDVTRWDDSASDLAIQPDGMIVAVGVAGYSWDTVATFALVRYDPDGTLDGSFGDNGKLRTRFPTIASDDPVGIVGAWATGVAIQPDGKIVLAGSAVRVLDGHLDGRFALARYRG